MSTNNTSPTGEHSVEYDGKTYKLKLSHWKVSEAETLLGTGVLRWTGGQITYNLALGYVMLDGQHGIKSRRDVAALFDEGPADLFDTAIAWAIVDFFHQYPDLAKGLEPVLESLKAKAEQKTPKKKTAAK